MPTSQCHDGCTRPHAPESGVCGKSNAPARVRAGASVHLSDGVLQGCRGRHLGLLYEGFSPIIPRCQDLRRQVAAGGRRCCRGSQISTARTVPIPLTSCGGAARRSRTTRRRRGGSSSGCSRASSRRCCCHASAAAASQLSRCCSGRPRPSTRIVEGSYDSLRNELGVRASGMVALERSLAELVLRER